MITIKLPLTEEINITNYINQYNSIFRFSYNRFQEGKEITEIEHIVKQKMNNIGLMDASLIKAAVNNAKSIKHKKVVFGSKKNWNDYNTGKITKEEYKNKKNRAIMIRGSKNDNKGNRKFELDIIENNQIVFKPKKGTKVIAKIPRTKHYKTLCLLETLCSIKETYFTCSISNNYIWVTFDEKILRKEEYKPIRKRIVAIDSNPNYIAFVVMQEEKILHREIIGIKELNQKGSTNKKKHEDHEVTKRIINTAKHYKVEHLVHETLSIKSSDKGKGKRFNKLCNNNWRRQRFFSSLTKHCNVIGINIQEVIAQYSSFVGQIDNENEYDSIAAAIEIGRRGLLFLNKFYYKENVEIKGKLIRINEILPVHLADRWKKKLNCTATFDSYLSLYNQIKKSKYSYRSLFQFTWFSSRFKSRKSLMFIH